MKRARTAEVATLAFCILLSESLSRGAEKKVNLSSLEAWRQPIGEWMTVKAVSLNPTNAAMFVITPGDGILVKGLKGKSVDDSGVYLMGRYEIQVYDSYGVEKDKYPGIECGGIYPRRVNEANALLPFG